MSVNITCCACGIVFGVPDAWQRARLETKDDFYCPNGHCQSYTQSTADKLRRERDRLKQQLSCKDDEIRRERDLRQHAERKVSAAKGQVTKLKNRSKAGVCPCCNRTFKQLAAHMKNKHPDYDPNVVDFDDEKQKRVG